MPHKVSECDSSELSTGAQKRAGAMGQSVKHVLQVLVDTNIGKS